MLNSLAVCFCSTLWSKISNALKRLGFRSHIRGILGRRALPLVGFVHFAVLRATLPAELCGSLWVRMESTVDAATDCWSGTWTARFRLCLALAIGRWLPFRRHGCHLLCNWPDRGLFGTYLPGCAPGARGKKLREIGKRSCFYEKC